MVMAIAHVTIIKLVRQRDTYSLAFCTLFFIEDLVDKLRVIFNTSRTMTYGNQIYPLAIFIELKLAK